MSRHVTSISNLKVGPYYFKQLDNLKYLRINFKYKNNMHNEIKIRRSVAYRAYFHMNKIQNSITHE